MKAELTRQQKRQRERLRERALDRLTETEIEKEISQMRMQRDQKNFSIENACAQRCSLGLQALSANIGDDDDAKEIKRLARKLIKAVFENGILLAAQVNYSDDFEVDDEDDEQTATPSE